MSVALASRQVGADQPITAPGSVAEITAPWMTQALRAGFPGTEVTSVTVGTLIHGTATKVRLMLTYNDAGHAHGLPPTLWLKGGYEAHSEQQIRIYAGEACFYRDLATRLDVGCAKAFFTHSDIETTGSVLVLEDLLARNATLGHATKPVGPAEAARVISLQAK